MGDRFPDVDWYCDRCHAHLNWQTGFDDNRYTWKCEDCGHKNSISRDNIYESREAFASSHDDGDDDADESISVWDAADIWLSNGMDEDYRFGYSEAELRRAADLE